MALPMCDQPHFRPVLALVPSCASASQPRPVAARLPASVYWFRRALAVAVLLVLLWASSLLAAKLQWALNPENPSGHIQPESAYVIMGDTAVPLSPDGR